jgi:hypothetical protein
MNYSDKILHNSMFNNTIPLKNKEESLNLMRLVEILDFLK